MAYHVEQTHHKARIVDKASVSIVRAKAHFDGIYHPSRDEARTADWIAKYKSARKRSMERTRTSLDRVRREYLHEVPVDMSIDIARVVAMQRNPPIRQDLLMRFFARFIRHNFVGVQKWQLGKAVEYAHDKQAQKGFLEELMRGYVSWAQKGDLLLAKSLVHVHPNDMVLFWKETGFTGASRLGVNLK